MAYSLKTTDETVLAGVARIARYQIETALEELGDERLSLAGKIHQVRKRCKKLRGLVRLVRPAFDGYSDENESFRDAARRLSSARDVQAVVETFDALNAHFSDQIADGAFARLRDDLERGARAAHDDPALDNELSRLGEDLRIARGRVDGWKLTEDGFAAVAGGFAKTYKRARKAMDRAEADPTPETLHQWRKRLKYHWYHRRLLARVAPDLSKPARKAADTLSDLLGDHHDLEVLRRRLGDVEPGADLQTLNALIHERQRQLAEAAFAQGRVLLTDKIDALLPRWEAWWQNWRSEDAVRSRIVV